MKFLLQPPIAPDRALLGGKAAALAALDDLPVPPWIAVAPAAYDALRSQDGSEHNGAAQFRAELATAVSQLAKNGELVAVRSSAVDEDGAARSFAGQLESYLNVPRADVMDRVADVWRSASSERVRAYRRESGLDSSPAPAVLIQRMVAADVAGVAFSADPVSGRRGVAVVSAVPGLGDKLVSGEVDADTFQVDRSGSIISRSHAPGRNPVALTDEQILAIASLARETERRFGLPQDIEWAIERGTLWLLQSRPITTISGIADPEGAARLWDNSNIAESYGGITTPLTYSFARRAYEEVYRQFCRLMRVPQSVIEDHTDTFRCMIGLVRGRVYYNLVSWHRVLAMLPGYKTNRRFMEQMMGVKESMPERFLPSSTPSNASEKARDVVRALSAMAGLIIQFCRLESQISEFYRRLNSALAKPPVPLAQMRPDELVAHYNELERQLLTRWDAPLVNDFFAMVFHGALRSMAQKWCGSPEGALANELIRDAGDIISTEPATRLKRLAALARPHPVLLNALSTGGDADVRRAAQASPEFQQELRGYLAKFGDRCLDELKLESATLHDDATALYRSIAALAARRVTPPVPPPANNANTGDAALEQARSLLAGHGVKLALFEWVARHARTRVRARENLRFERTRLFGRVRRIFVEMGKRLHACGRLENPRDVFYLDLNEVIGFVDGTATTTDLKGLVSVRQAEFARFKTLPAPADRFETRAMVNHGNTYEGTAKTSVTASDGETRQGLPCCAGIVRSKVRVITDPAGAHLEPGEILVAERTDPGWILLFPAASGLLVERGSLLSHSAIVSRELGLPGVVAIPGLTAWLSTGDEVEMDGATGRVTRVAQAR